MEFLGQNTLNQLISNTSAGFFNVRAEEYGGEMFDPMGAPAVNVGVQGVNDDVSGTGATYSQPDGSLRRTHRVAQADR